MAEHQPQKTGEYERPMIGTSSSLALIIAVLFLR
jgi:hypothetical protein